MMIELLGLYPALITPFKDDQSLDTEKLKDIINFHIEQSSSGLYLGGTTDEGILQSREERIWLVDEAIRLADHKLKIIVHVGANSTNEAIQLAQAAEKSGADAISAIPPLFYKLGPSGVLEYYRELSESTTLPFIIYYIPHLSGYSLWI